MLSRPGAIDPSTPVVAPSWPTGEPLRALIASRLDPLDAPGPEPLFRSDLDLNPALKLAVQAQGYELAAVLIGLVEREGGPSVLLTRRADSLRRHAGQIAFPGGRSEPGEAPWRTAQREAHEEIGLEPGQVTLAGLSTGFRLQTGYQVTPVVGFVDPAFRPTPSADEVAEVFEAPFAFLMDPHNYRHRQVERSGVGRLVYEITYGEHVIWGATASMLRALSDRLLAPPHEEIARG